ncbi:hypothetical protein C8R44DRAFT_890812 [Mycena epipterygia]|nr:hypothetical protein C8R44DRAFT_890812 [Mycena epipterygia]
MYWLRRALLWPLPNLAYQDPADLEGTTTTIALPPPVHYFERRSNYSPKMPRTLTDAQNYSLLWVVGYKVDEEHVVDSLDTDGALVNGPWDGEHWRTSQGLTAGSSGREDDGDSMPELV